MTDFDITPSWANAPERQSSWQPGQSRRLQDLFLRPQASPVAPESAQDPGATADPAKTPWANSDLATLLTITGGQ